MGGEKSQRQRAPLLNISFPRNVMLRFVARFLVLIGAGTVTALTVVLMTSGLVDIGVGESWESGVIPGLVLLGGPVLIMVWYEGTEIDEQQLDT